MREKIMCLCFCYVCVCIYINIIEKPIHKFGKRYSAGPIGNNPSNAPNQAGKHIDGQYNENDFDFLN